MDWISQQRIIVKVENRFIPILTRYIRKYFKRGLELYREGRQDELNNDFFDTELIGIIKDIYRVSGVSMARYVYKTMPKVRELESKATGQMGISTSWLDAVMTFLNNSALEFVTDIVGTLRDTMLKTFAKAAQEGWSYEKTATVLMDEGIPLRRARVIARTEAHRGAITGSVAGADSLPYEVQKRWLAANDSRVRRVPRARFDHRELDGQIRELHEPFRNQEEIMQPGDPKASAGNSIQCRCVLTYIPKRDERGRLIMKKR